MIALAEERDNILEATSRFIFPFGPPSSHPLSRQMNLSREEGPTSTASRRFCFLNSEPEIVAPIGTFAKSSNDERSTRVSFSEDDSSVSGKSGFLGHLSDPNPLPETKNQLRVLEKLLIAIFFNDEVPMGVEELQRKESEFLASVLQRKFGLKVELPLSTCQLREALSPQIIHPSHKRKEENRKFVFKKISKVLRSKFAKGLKIGSLRKVNKKVIDDEFYKHYFGALSEASKIPLEDFILPGSCTKRVGQSKTFTDSYIRLINQSESFRADFERELRAHIVSNLKPIVRAKIAKILSKYEQEISLSEGRGKSNRGCGDRKAKLPWTCQEISTAFRSVLQFLTNDQT